MLIYCSAWKQMNEMSKCWNFFLDSCISPPVGFKLFNSDCMWRLFFGIIACWIIMLRVTADFSWAGFSFPLYYAVAVDEFAQSIDGKVNSHFWSTFTYWIFFSYLIIWMTFKLPFVGFFFSLCIIPFRISCYLEKFMWTFSSFLYLMLK